MVFADNGHTNSVKVINVGHAGCRVDKLTGLFIVLVCRSLPRHVLRELNKLNRFS